MIYCDDLPEEIITDPTRLRQCLVNLIGNAIKFTARGHVSLRVSLLGMQHDKTMIKFEVEDSGIGIDRGNQTCIFESFSQADSGTSRKYGGTGLGLAITKQLVELLNGNISLSSEHGKGSIFTIIIPVDVNSSDDHQESKNSLVSSQNRCN
jgi:signal transduction histidine kinase